MNTAPLEILFEDNHCLVVSKPARCLTAPDETGDETILDLAKAYLKRKYQKPGEVYLGLVHRLDRPVSGVLLLARTSKAAARLSEQFRERDVHKVYHALVEGTPVPESGTLTDFLLKRGSGNKVRAVEPNTPGAKRSVLSYRVLEPRGNFSLLEVRPETGRSHQIRSQLSHQGWPICGDGKYGSRTPRWEIALHARSLEFVHPTRSETISVIAPYPPFWKSYGWES